MVVAAASGVHDTLPLLADLAARYAARLLVVNMPLILGCTNVSHGMHSLLPAWWCMLHAACLLNVAVCASLQMSSMLRASAHCTRVGRCVDNS